VIFPDRRDAGRALARRLSRWANRGDVLVLALPRGGVPVGIEVARALGAPFDVFVVRKLGVPGHEELAMGAIASGGVRVLQGDVIADLGIPSAAVEDATRREEGELGRRERAFREGRPAADVEGKTVILVDDGLATGATMRAAIAGLRRREPEAIVVAVPVGAPETCAAIARLADDCVCLETPAGFSAVGLWYEDFEQTTDEEVRQLLSEPAPTI
jgi:predicted phosphoribosyltransferase